MIQTAFSELLKNSSMQMLYDSESFVVVHMQLDSDGEVVDASEIKKPVIWPDHSASTINKAVTHTIFLRRTQVARTLPVCGGVFFVSRSKRQCRVRLITVASIRIETDRISLPNLPSRKVNTCSTAGSRSLKN